MKLMDLFYRSRFLPWAIWGLAALLGLYTFLLQGAPSVMIPQLMQTFRIDVIQIGVLTSSFFYTYILMQIPAGILIDIWGPRRALWVNVFIFYTPPQPFYKYVVQRTPLPIHPYLHLLFF